MSLVLSGATFGSLKNRYYCVYVQNVGMSGQGYQGARVKAGRQLRGVSCLL